MSDDAGIIFQRSPLLTALTAAAVLLTCLNTFSTSLLLSPFWLDLITGLACFLVAINWFNNILRRDRLAELYTASRALGAAPLRALLSSVAKPRQLVLWLIPGMLLAASWFFLRAPVRHLFEPKWSLCGTFITRCEKSCLVLLDDRKRDVLGQCLMREDDSGYREIKANDLWTYRPSLVSAECEGKVGTIAKLPAQMFSQKCEGVWKE